MISNWKEQNITFGNDGNITVSWMNEWTQWFQNTKMKWSWKNFTLIHIEYEDDIMCGSREITIILFGFGFNVRWKHETEESKMSEMKESWDDIMKNSFYAWVDETVLNAFKNKTDDDLPVTRTRKRARELGWKKPKKLFIL